MMKRLWMKLGMCLLLAALCVPAMSQCTLLGAGLAEGDISDGSTMVVVNCDEWVSLREAPSTSAARITTVPLGAVVYNCTPYTGDFTQCEYSGMVGYILSEYLQTVDGDAPSASQTEHGRLILEHAIEEYTVYAYYDFAANGESLYVECLDAQGIQVWNYASSVPFSTELQGADAFIGGTEERPLVLVFNAGEGIYALDFYTGQVQWLLPNDTVNFGGGISHAVSSDGTVYVGGYYGPDPVAIDVDGNVLWEAKPDHDAYWMHEIEVTEEGVVATYDCIDEHEAAGQIIYGFDGTVLNVVWF